MCDAFVSEACYPFVCFKFKMRITVCLDEGFCELSDIFALVPVFWNFQRFFPKCLSVADIYGFTEPLDLAACVVDIKFTDCMIADSI